MSENPRPWSFARPNGGVDDLWNCGGLFAAVLGANWLEAHAVSRAPLSADLEPRQSPRASVYTENTSRPPT